MTVSMKRSAKTTLTLNIHCLFFLCVCVFFFFSFHLLFCYGEGDIWVWGYFVAVLGLFWNSLKGRLKLQKVSRKTGLPITRG